MEEFPFTKVEWDLVSEAARRVANTAFADDMLYDARLAELQAALRELRSKHGEHPALLETEADFLDDSADRVALYLRAAQVADEHKLETITIRISLARVLLEELKDANAAKCELLACEAEQSATSDEAVQKEWLRLRTECDRMVNSVPVGR